ncbi:hypothetical protein NL676_028558 [Syzygium grande]|nr:hypothetical protein NL676_028558 [Syzygium grande]
MTRLDSEMVVLLTGAVQGSNSATDAGEEQRWGGGVVEQQPQLIRNDSRPRGMIGWCNVGSSDGWPSKGHGGSSGSC